jgi:hypothetical protein
MREIWLEQLLPLALSAFAFRRDLRKSFSRGFFHLVTEGERLLLVTYGEAKAKK